MTELLAWTDGACSGNPGPGGWGVVLVAQRDGIEIKRRALYGGEAETTNNRMELMAAIEALRAFDRPAALVLHTDSAYVRNGITNWIEGWKRNGWRTADKKPVKNADLWQILDHERQRHQVHWQWVKGHAGDPNNEEADRLARQGMAAFQVKSRA